MYEIVIFTAGTKEYADEILNCLDPEGKLIMHRLYRHHTSVYGINIIK
jgi:TFIIF-interacting CTD phosphatase-like protein